MKNEFDNLVLKNLNLFYSTGMLDNIDHSMQSYLIAKGSQLSIDKLFGDKKQIKKTEVQLSNAIITGNVGIMPDILQYKSIFDFPKSVQSKIYEFVNNRQDYVENGNKEDATKFLSEKLQLDLLIELNKDIGNKDVNNAILEYIGSGQYYSQSNSKNKLLKVLEKYGSMVKKANTKFVLWLTGNDEVVCSVCKNKDGKIYLINDEPDNWHFGCRCKKNIF